MLLEQFWSQFPAGTMFVLQFRGCFGVYGFTSKIMALEFHQCQCIPCSTLLFWHLDSFNLVNSGKPSPYECCFNALQRCVTACSDPQLCCVRLRGTDESHWAAWGRFLLHWLPPVRGHCVSHWPRYVTCFPYILAWFELWGRREESLNPLWVPSFWIFELNLFVIFLEIRFVSICLLIFFGYVQYSFQTSAFLNPCLQWSPRQPLSWLCWGLALCLCHPVPATVAEQYV